MLPYQILVGLKRTMCNRCQGFIAKQKMSRQLLSNIQNICNSTLILSKNTLDLRLFYNNINSNQVQRFHTQILTCYQSTQKGSKYNDRNNSSTLAGTQIDKSELLSDNYKQDTKEDVDNKKNVPESVKKWLFTNIDKSPVKDIQSKFPEPKVCLNNFYIVVANETKIHQCLVSSCKSVPGKYKNLWMYTYNIKWPENKTFTTISHSKAAASTSTASKILYWLHLNKKIKNRLPIIYQKSETLSLLNQPEELNVEAEVLNKIKEFLDTYEKDIINSVSIKNSERPESFEEIRSTEQILQHPISNFKVNPVLRNTVLQSRLQKKVKKSDLPIFNYKSQILKELDENQALVIKGDTGCGKTTQVPQFIIDHMTEKGQASDCSMIVTQPRRISAISLAQRVAFEREESVGDVIGYQVRLQQVLPKQQGAILFCTTGILLKKLQGNLTLQGCSHVIVDEAHERNVDTDMLLVLLKRAMEKNLSLKVVIMSATINADLFQEYLNCNAVEVPGRLYPVKMNFLDEIRDLGIRVFNQANSEEQEPVIDCQQITDLILYINQNKPPGAILCFLPGWAQIQRVQRNLEFFRSNLNVIPLHSKIPWGNQSKIFEPPEEGMRKVILATDIAETGITVPDVVYVVDSACHKEIRWHEHKGLSSINTHWITKANVNQRKGRAGRVQKGESYHFITRRQYEDLDEYPKPEVLRVSLEKTVLDCKTYSDEKVENFLSSMPQPPRLSAVKKAVTDLQTLGALNENQDLTPLGKRIALFTVHPKLSKAMVYSAIFQCLSPVTTVSSALSLDSEIFYGTLDNKSRIRKTKAHFHPTSDHLAIAWIYAQWSSYFNRNPEVALRFCRQNGLHNDRMNILHKVRNINLEHLHESGLTECAETKNELKSELSQFAAVDELVCGILLAGMDQILKHRNFEFRKGRLAKSGSSMITEDDAKAQLTPECVNHKRSEWPSPYLIYYQKTHHQDRRTTLIRESSMVSPVTVLLFSQGRVIGSMYKDEKQTEEKVLLKISGKQNVNLVCNELTANIILKFRDVMWLIIKYYVENEGQDKLLYESDCRNNIAHYKKEMLTVLANLLDSASSYKGSSDSSLHYQDDENF